MALNRTYQCQTTPDLTTGSNVNCGLFRIHASVISLHLKSSIIPAPELRTRCQSRPHWTFTVSWLLCRHSNNLLKLGMSICISAPFTGLTLNSTPCCWPPCISPRMEYRLTTVGLQFKPSPAAISPQSAPLSSWNCASANLHRGGCHDSETGVVGKQA